MCTGKLSVLIFIDIRDNQIAKEAMKICRMGSVDGKWCIQNGTSLWWVTRGQLLYSIEKQFSLYGNIQTCFWITTNFQITSRQWNGNFWMNGNAESVCVYMCVFTCTWRPQVGCECVLQLTSNLFFQTWSHTEPDAHR